MDTSKHRMRGPATVAKLEPLEQPQQQPQPQPQPQVEVEEAEVEQVSSSPSINSPISNTSNTSTRATPLLATPTSASFLADTLLDSTLLTASESFSSDLNTLILPATSPRTPTPAQVSRNHFTPNSTLTTPQTQSPQLALSTPHPFVPLASVLESSPTTTPHRNSGSDTTMSRITLSRPRTPVPNVTLCTALDATYRRLSTNPSFQTFCISEGCDPQQIIVGGGMMALDVFELATQLKMQPSKLLVALTEEQEMHKLTIAKLRTITEYLERARYYGSECSGATENVFRDRALKADAVNHIVNLVAQPEGARARIAALQRNASRHQLKLDADVASIKRAVADSKLARKYLLIRPALSKRWDIKMQDLKKKSAYGTFTLPTDLPNGFSVFLVVLNKTTLLTNVDITQRNSLSVNATDVQPAGVLTKYVDITGLVKLDNQVNEFDILFKTNQRRADFTGGTILVLVLMASTTKDIKTGGSFNTMSAKINEVIETSLKNRESLSDIYDSSKSFNPVYMARDNANTISTGAFVAYDAFTPYNPDTQPTKRKDAAATSATSTTTTKKTNIDLWNDYINGDYKNDLATQIARRKLTLKMEDDIIPSDEYISFMCPLSLVRIEFPARSSKCKHKQCFDCKSFIQLIDNNDMIPCPLCNNKIGLKNLTIDPYFYYLLNKYPNYDSCIIHPDYTDSPPKSLEDLARESSEALSQRSAANPMSMTYIPGTPTSRKRTLEIIDLIESDDDDVDYNHNHNFNGNVNGNGSNPRFDSEDIPLSRRLAASSQSGSTLFLSMSPESKRKFVSLRSREMNQGSRTDSTGGSVRVVDDDDIVLLSSDSE